MEASGFKARGSFGVPPEMRRDLEEQRRKTAEKAEANPHQAPVVSHAPPTQEPASPEQTPAAAEQKNKPPSDEDKQAAYEKLKKELEEKLQAVITPEDIKEYIFKGSLTKEVSVIPGVLKCTFKTLTPTDYLEVDKREAQYRDEGSYTVDGLINQRAVVNLSYAWIAAAGKPLSAQNEPTVREKHIRKLGAHLVESAVTANQDFNGLLRLVLQEKAFIKKF